MFSSSQTDNTLVAYQRERVTKKQGFLEARLTHVCPTGAQGMTSQEWGEARRATWLDRPLEIDVSGAGKDMQRDRLQSKGNPALA